MQRMSWDVYFVNMAFAASQRGTCPRAQVGAVLVLHEQYPVATGFNGSRAKELHCIDVGCEIVDDHCVRTVHAEANAIRIAQDVLSLDTDGMWLYCTHAPCQSCADKIMKAGIKRVCYRHGYTPSDGLDFLNKYIAVQRINTSTTND